MRWLVFLLLLNSCAPVYYGSIIYDVETTLACKGCRERNPVVFVDIANRPLLYGYSIAYAAAFTLLAERTKHEKLFYAIATTAHLVAATLNLRYVKY